MIVNQQFRRFLRQDRPYNFFWQPLDALSSGVAVTSAPTACHVTSLMRRTVNFPHTQSRTPPERRKLDSELRVVDNILPDAS